MTAVALAPTRFPVPPQAVLIEEAMRQLMVIPLEVIPAFFGDPVPAVARAALPEEEKEAVVTAINSFLICMALDVECGLKPTVKPMLISLPFPAQLHIICSMAALRINPTSAPQFFNQHFC